MHRKKKDTHINDSIAHIEGQDISIKGEDIQQALIEWVKSDIKDIGKTSNDVGKFFFSVSVSSMALLATLQKLDSSFTPTFSRLIPYGILLISLLLSLNFILPRNIKVTGSSNLTKLHMDEVKFITSRIWFWFVAWLIGVISALFILLGK